MSGQRGSVDDGYQGAQGGEAGAVEAWPRDELTAAANDEDKTKERGKRLHVVAGSIAGLSFCLSLDAPDMEGKVAYYG